MHYARRPATKRAPVVVRGDLSAATMRAFDHLITAERALVHAADMVLAVSEFAATDLAAAYHIPRPMVIANGVERDHFHPAPSRHRPGASGSRSQRTPPPRPADPWPARPIRCHRRGVIPATGGADWYGWARRPR